MANSSADQVLWPPSRAMFDLTLQFEESVLGLAPSSIVIASAPILIIHYRKNPARVQGSSSLLWAKLFAAAGLVAIEIATVALRTASSDFRTITTLPSVAVDLVAAITVGLIICMEHRHAMRGSAFIAIYLLVAIVFDIVKSRSFFSRPGLNPFGPEFASRLLYPDLKQKWQTKEIPSKRNLLTTCFRAWKVLFIAILVPRLCHSVFSFAQPFLLYRLIQVVTEERATTSTQEKVVLALATLITFVGKTVAKTTTSHMKNRLVTHVRGGLITMMLDKGLSLPQQEASKSSVLTLMSTDMEGIAAGLPDLHELFFTPFELGLGIYFLSRFVGKSCFVVIAPLAASTIATYFFGKWMRSRLMTWNEYIEHRVAQTSKILGQLTAIKMFGLGKTIESYLQGLREVEIRASKRYRNLQSAANIPPIFADLVTPVVVVAAALFWRTFDGGISAATVFPSLIIIVLVKGPLALLLVGYPGWTGMLGCFQRVQKFLLLEDRKDPRTITRRPDTTTAEETAVIHADDVVARLSGANLAPLCTQVPVLQDVNFSITAGSFNCVLGPSGSGKSLLLQSILGEVELMDGSICLDDEYAGYCGQMVWLRNASIKSNIVGPGAYDERLFKKVIRCCLLEDDIRQLPGGVDYVVGTGGVKLSGGQRQRVALARTLFARMSLVLLDNVFSSLDRRTAVSILFRLCGEDGFFREEGTTVVLTSYLPEVIDIADQLLVLDGNGHLTVDQSPSRDAARAKYAQSMISQENLRSEDEEATEQAAIRRSEELRQRPPTEPTVNPINSRRRSLRLYRLFFGTIGYLRTVLWCFSMLVVSAGECAPEVYMRIWIDVDPNNNSYFIGYAAIASCTCVLFALVFASLCNHLTPRAALQLHSQLTSTVVGGTIAFLCAIDKGVLVNRFSQDMSLVVRNLPLAFMRTIYIFWTAVIQTGIVASGASYMVIAIPFIIIAFYLIQGFYLRTSRQMRSLDLEAKSPLYTHFEETAAGLLCIRGFGWQAENLKRGFDLLDDSQKAFYYMITIQQWLGLVVGLLIASLGSILVAFALFLSESTSDTAIGLAFLNLILFGQTLEMLIGAWTNLETSVGALARLEEFMKETPQEDAQKLATLPRNWPSMGNIELTDMSAQYRDDPEHEPVLRNVTLAVGAGKKVGLIGRTGSGKSSLFLALLGFLPYKGVMKIDGIDVASVPPDELRSRIITVSQDQIRLEASIRVNLLPFTLNSPDVLDEKKREAAERRDIALRELLMRLGIWSHVEDKGGVDAMLDDAGYSHGEMQLFCLARGILRYKDTGSKVVLIDEATSSVDEERERSAQEIMRESFPDCTMLVIGHGRSSIRGVDCMVELANGRVAHIDHSAADTD
ncbi:hypothetical protein LMH87_012178 [Akanthomyces muscarius]|uniref:ABC multidrug transporter n=1 Tax=Akanthomyces muscarius TaxID=2231603 RepID=A0A9W8QAM3_AKAMU|nr:hypothetical protein LMH87_012178 [Akanthomyces muscarius]KAJ4151482.1 hypothetical protein LMH87_012178 [Akanthomyces muscarius]